MRGGVAVWKRGSGGRGVKAAVAYAVQGACDASTAHEHDPEAVIAAAKYAGQTVSRHTVMNGTITRDELDTDSLTDWVKGNDPLTGGLRGSRVETSEQANMLYDATINFPKTYSLAGMLHPELQHELDSLMDRIRDKTITVWQAELNGRRGAGGLIRESLSQIEVVELEHARSRALDPHAHRHTWLSTKVLGVDGNWSNVDSSVMMKMQPLINGYGEVMARTDKRWLATLQRFGMGLDTEGEIRELAHLSRPFSKRNEQIARNVAVIERQWRASNPNREPSATDRGWFDTQAYKVDRPAKPAELDEMDWAQERLEEIAAIDPHIQADLAARFDSSTGPPEVVSYVTTATVDRDLLALIGVAEADARSARSNDRFNMLTLRGSVLNAIAKTGIVAGNIDDPALVDLIEDVTARAMSDHVSALVEETNLPQHIRAYRANATIRVRQGLEEALTAIQRPGVRMLEASIRLIDAEVNENPLDARQAEAAGLIAGTDRLVSIVGPAGTGKTTMLRVVAIALEQQHRKLLVVAPSLKAAQVAGTEIGADADSLHKLLHAYGYRWADTATGDQWRRLQVGELDLDGRMNEGPAARFALVRGDRLVVDEAGMMDLYAASALAQICAETGAGLALVGDPRQLDPVGHGGAMQLAARLSDAGCELAQVHRFRTAAGATDTDYAALTLRIREPHDRAEAAQLAAALGERGQIVAVPDVHAEHAHIVGEYMTRPTVNGRRSSMVIVTATNEQAQVINTLIQRARIDAGQIDPTIAALAQGGQLIHVGDRIQARKNAAGLGVANRDELTVTAILDNGDVTARRAGDLQGANVTLDADYLSEHTHLSYAATAHGVQGVTVDRAILASGVTGAGAYVGLTRGRERNEMVVIAKNTATAQETVAAAIGQAIPEDTVEETRAAIAAELARAARDRVETNDEVYSRLDKITDSDAFRVALDELPPEQRVELLPRIQTAQLAAREITAESIRARAVAVDTAARRATAQARDRSLGIVNPSNPALEGDAPQQSVDAPTFGI